MAEPDLLTGYLMLRGAAVTAAASLLFGIAICGPEWLRKRDSLLLSNSLIRLCASSVPVGTVCFIAGYLAATSRTGAIGNLIPAMIGALAGLHIYVFGKENQQRALIAFMIVIASGMTLYGVQYGAYRRDIGREARLYEAMRLEYRIMNIRKTLGLGEAIPGWALGVEPK